MLDTIAGLPVHALVVHAVVVLLPLAALGTILLAARPVWRQRYGGLNALVAVLGLASVPVATASGSALAARVGDPGRHAALGSQLLWFALPLAVLAVALWLLSRGGDPRRPSKAANVVAVVGIVAALACGVQVFRVGDSGADAVWADIIEFS